MPDGPFVRGHAVLQQHAGDTDGIEPLADFRAFEVERQDTIAAAGEDDDRGAGVLPVCRRKDLDGGVGDSADASDAFARDQVVGWSGGVLFFTRSGLFARSSVGPERDWSGWGGERGYGDEREADEVHGHDFML